MSPTKRERVPGVLAVLLAFLLILASVPAIRHLRELPPPPPPPVRLSLALPPDLVLGSGNDVLDAAVSPDGRQLAFVATAAGQARLWHRAFDGDRSEPLEGTDGSSGPAWKRDGRTIAFFAQRRLKSISLPDLRVSELANAPDPGGAAWSADGSLLFVPDTHGPVQRLRAGVAANVTTLGPGDRGHSFPAATDGGFLYIATRNDGSRVVRAALGGPDVDLTMASGHAEMVDGHLLYVRDGVLLARTFDPARRVLTGSPTPIGLNIGVSGSGHAFFSASPRVLVWASAAPNASELAWFDVSGRKLGTVADPGEYWQVRIAPDDRRLAVTAVEPNLRTLDIFVVPLDQPTNDKQRLSLALAADSDPVWSPDSTRVAFRSMRTGTGNLFIRRIGSPDAREEPVIASELDKTALDWRGDAILFQAPRATGGMDLWVLDIARRAEAQLTRSGFTTRDARWSPDRSRIAYASDESGRSDIYIEPWPRDGRRTRVSFAGGTRPEWSGNGRQLFFIREGELMQARLRDGGFAAGVESPVAIPGLRGVRDYALAHHSERVLVLTAPTPRDQPPAHVEIDWQSLVESPTRR